MTTDVALCSRALVLLGAGAISSLDEETDRAIICKNAYPGLKLALLSKAPWRFLMTKRELTRDATAPVGEWRYSYIVPGSAIAGAPRVVFYGTAGKRGQVRYEQFGRRLFTDEARMFVDQVEDKPESEWPGYFQQAVVYALCAEISYAITDQQGVADAWTARAYGSPSENGLGGAFGDALSLDAQGSANIGFENDAFIDARFGGYGAHGYTWQDV